jgi:hypothetical protein
MSEAKARKIIQLAVACHGDGGSEVWLLCDDGSVWALGDKIDEHGTRQWEEIDTHDVEE